MPTDVCKSLRPSQENQKTTMQNTIFELTFSTHRDLDCLFTLPLFLHFKVHSSHGRPLKYRK